MTILAAAGLLKRKTKTLFTELSELAVKMGGKSKVDLKNIFYFRYIHYFVETLQYG